MNIGKPPKWKSVEELQNEIDAYFISCQDPNNPNIYIKPLTITGLANALDTNRQTLLNYEKAEGYEQYFDTIKRAKSKVEQYVEEYLFVGKNQTGAIFNLKNNYQGWKDKTEQEISGEGLKIQFSDVFKKNNI